MTDDRHLDDRNLADPHLDHQTWEQLACGELSRRERSAALAHVERCDSCAATWSALEEVRSAASDFDPYLSELPEPAPRSTWRPAWLALAAAMLAAVGVTWWVGDGSTLRGSIASGTRESAEVDRAGIDLAPELLSPADGARGAFERFEWSAPSGQTAVRVELLDAEGEPLWTSGAVAGATLPWPPEVVREPGVYFWRVVAVEAASPLARFEITR